MSTRYARANARMAARWIGAGAGRRVSVPTARERADLGTTPSTLWLSARTTEFAIPGIERRQRSESTMVKESLGPFPVTSTGPAGSKQSPNSRSKSRVLMPALGAVGGPASGAAWGLGPGGAGGVGGGKTE